LIDAEFPGPPSPMPTAMHVGMFINEKMHEIYGPFVGEVMQEIKQYIANKYGVQYLPLNLH